MGEEEDMTSRNDDLSVVDDALGFVENDICACIRPVGHHYGCECEHGIERVAYWVNLRGREHNVTRPLVPSVGRPSRGLPGLGNQYRRSDPSAGRGYRREARSRRPRRLRDALEVRNVDINPSP